MPDHEYHGVTTPNDWACSHCGHSRAEHFCMTGFARESHDFVAMSRVHNEARWINEVIESVLPLCARVFVLDDHSTDNTVEICRRYKQVTVFPSPFDGRNEARDKNWLLDQVMRACEPRWILCVDGDEVLAPGGPEIIRRTLGANPTCQAFSLKIVFLWNDRQTVRTDWVYGDFWRPSLFAPFHPLPDNPDHIPLARELRFKETPWGRQRGNDKPNLHCSSVPQRLIHNHQKCPASLLHLGYMHREDRVRKLDFYNSIDWLNREEDCYRHMTQGDGVLPEELPGVQQLVKEGLISEGDIEFLTDLPAEVKHNQQWRGRPLLHSGPLTLEPVPSPQPPAGSAA